MLNIFQRLKRLLGRNRRADASHDPIGQNRTQGPDPAADIYNAIGQKLWSIMPPEAEEIYFRSKIYDDMEMRGASWRNRDGSNGHFDREEGEGNALYALEEEVQNLLKELKNSPIFTNSPWNQVLITLTDTGKIRAEFADIHYDDMDFSLHMQGVSDVTLQEAAAAFIDRDTWINMCKAAIECKSAAAQQADEEGNQALANGLRGEVEAIKNRLEDAVS